MNESIEKWLESSSANKFLQQEKLSFQKVSDGLSGNLGLQLTLSNKFDYLSSVNVAKQCFTYQSDVLKIHSEEQSSLISSVDHIPFDNSQFGVVIAPRLEMVTEDLQASLREVCRITANEGYVLLSGINPISLIGLQSKVFPQKYALPQSIGVNQMKSWLSLLGFDIVGSDFFHYSAMNNTQHYPSLSEKVEDIGNRWLPVFSGAYWLVAKKRVLAGRMINSTKKAKLAKTGKIAGSVARKF